MCYSLRYTFMWTMNNNRAFTSELFKHMTNFIHASSTLFKHVNFPLICLELITNLNILLNRGMYLCVCQSLYIIGHSLTLCPLSRGSRSTSHSAEASSVRALTNTILCLCNSLQMAVISLCYFQPGGQVSDSFKGRRHSCSKNWPKMLMQWLGWPLCLRLNTFTSRCLLKDQVNLSPYLCCSYRNYITLAIGKIH